MLSPAALFVSRPTTADPVTARSRPAGAGGRSVFTQSRMRSTAMRVFFETCVPSNRTIVSTAWPWPSALVPTSRGPMTGVLWRSSFLIPSSGLERQLEQLRGHIFDEAEILLSHTSMLAFVYQDKLGARGIGGEASFQQVVPDNAQGIGGEEADVIVFGYLLPARCEMVQAGGEDQPGDDHGPGAVDHKSRQAREHRSSNFRAGAICEHRHACANRERPASRMPATGSQFTAPSTVDGDSRGRSEIQAASIVESLTPVNNESPRSIRASRAGPECVNPPPGTCPGG